MSDTQVRPPPPSYSLALSLGANILPNTMSNPQSAESPNASRMGVRAALQISKEIQIHTPKQFVPPSRQRDATDLNTGIISSSGFFTGISTKSKALDLPSPLSPSVALEKNSADKAGMSHGLVRLRQGT